MDIYSKLTDQELAVLLKESDHDAFAEIYNRYWGLLYIHARKILQDEDDVKDVIQELFVSLWNKAGEIEFTTSLSSYLYSAVRNRIFNLIEHQKIKVNYVASIGSFMEQGEATTDALVRYRELAQLIEKEIALLPPKMREIFELSRKEYLSHKEIAERLNISDKTVRKQVNNAIRILRLRLNVSIGLIFILLHR